jgi:hypothetical protein
MNRQALGIRLLVDMVLAAVCATGAYLSAAGQDIPEKPIVVLFALIAGCGWAIVGWIDTTEVAFVGTLVAAAGVTISMFVSLAAVGANWWHPEVTVSVLLAAACLANSLHIARDIARRSRCAR